MQFFDELKKYQIILASNSPRRHFLLKEIGVDFTVMKPENVEEIPMYLAKLKADSLKSKIKQNDIVITADTIVWLENEAINKPEDKEDAIRILKKLSGKTHQVYSGICITSLEKQISFSSKSDVKFNDLSDEEINFYIEKYKPFDKAGAYGIQEWIGYIGIEYINGSFYNVMGLPIQKLYRELKEFIAQI